MSNSVPISFTPAPKIGHQTIGKNGSFWLPPEMQTSSFQSHLKNYQGTKPQPPQPQLIREQGALSKDHNSSGLPSPKQPGGTHSRGLKSHARHDLLKNAQSHLIAGNKETLAKQSSPSSSKGNHLAGQLRTVGTQVPAVPVLARSHPVQSSNPLLPFHSSVSLKSISLNDTDRRAKETMTSKNQSYRRYLDESEDRGGRDGAKSASGGLSEKSLAGKFNRINIDLESLDISDLHFNQSFSESVLHKLLPLLAHDSRTEADVVRFSFDFPEGDQATIRLEMVDDHLDVAVVCSNYKNYPWLQDSLDILFHQVESETKISTDVQIFNSFEDYDQSNLRPLPSLK